MHLVPASILLLLSFKSSAFQKGAFYTLAGAHLALQYFQALACRPLSLSDCSSALTPMVTAVQLAVHPLRC